MASFLLRSLGDDPFYWNYGISAVFLPGSVLQIWFFIAFFGKKCLYRLHYPPDIVMGDEYYLSLYLYSNYPEILHRFSAYHFLEFLAQFSGS